MEPGRPIELIHNPASGRGRVAGLVRQARDAFRAAGAAEFTDRVSASLDDLGRATVAAAERGALPVILGGDGSLCAAVRALAERRGFQGSLPPVGLLPGGTGNDLLRSLGALPFARALPRVVNAWRRGETRWLDAMRIEILDGPAVGVRFALGLWGMGLAAEVVCHAARLRRFGRAAYALGGAACLATHRPFDARLAVDGREREGRFDMLAVSKCPYVGGGMPIAPGLRPDDGVLQLLSVRIPGNLRLLLSMIPIFRGDHRRQPGVETGHIGEIRLTTANPAPMIADGDLFLARAVRLTLQPRMLPLALSEAKPSSSSSSSSSSVGIPGSRSCA